MSLLLYLSVFGALIGSTIVELSVIQLSLPATSATPLLIGLASIKALLIALFFQHLKDEPGPLSSLLMLAVIAAMVLMVLSWLQ